MACGEHAPFERISSEVLVDHAWHRYRRDAYTLRDGTRGYYHYIDIGGSAAAVPLFDDHTVALVHAYRYLLGCWLWELPIGGMKHGEDPCVVARRELEEEGGLRAGRMDSIGRFAPYKGASNEVCHFFVARDLEDVGQRLEPSEAITVHRMPLDRARAHLLDQELGDGQSLAGWMLFERWLAQS